VETPKPVDNDAGVAQRQQRNVANV
jgi:hypothetical protein